MNTITIELCAEDRARLDRLTAALEERAAQPTTPAPDEAQQKLAEIVAKTAAEPQEAETVTDTQPEPEQPKEAPKTEPQEAENKPAPTVTLEQIQQKVVQLAAGFGGSKKAAVREIVNAYAKKVSDLPEDKWTDVWEKLTALEQEA